MSFDLCPAEFLQFFLEAYEEFSADPLSIRKAIAACVFANHIPEHLVAAYMDLDRAKLRGAVGVKSRDVLDDYREKLSAEESALKLIRDLCDYAKHGPKLHRLTVTVSKTEQATTVEMDWNCFLVGIPNHVPVDKLVVTHKDGSDWLEAILWKAREFWEKEFAAQSLYEPPQ